MDRSGRGSLDERDVIRVSDAMVEKRAERTLGGSLRKLNLWVLVDLPRWAAVIALAALVYVATMIVGVFGPVSVQQYLLSGTSIANAYIELQPGVITAITVVLAINQLVLSPEFGRLGQQRNRLQDVLSHRRDVEENADVVSSPTNPTGFLRTVVDGVREHAGQLESATGEDPDLDQRVAELVDELEADLTLVGDALEAERFGRIEMLGASMHFDTAHFIHEFHKLHRTYESSLSGEQLRVLDDLEQALEHYTIAREYFRTLYLQAQFIRFSRAVLFTGLPALLVAHYSIGIIGPNALPGTTLGVRTLLWFEAGTFTVTLVPIVVIVSYVARLVTLAETTIFISPFSPDREA